MPATILRNRLRIAVDALLKRGGPLVDVILNAQPIAYQAEDLQVELGVMYNGLMAPDITNFASITMQLKDAENLLGAPLFSQTILAVNLHTVTDLNWGNGSDQTALFILANTDTNIELNARQSRTLEIYFFATTTDGTPRRIPLGKSPFTLSDSGYGDIGALTVVSPGARMKAAKIQIKNQDDGLYYNTVLRNVGGDPVVSVEGNGEA